MIENEKKYTEKEMQEKMMTQLYEKAKQSYQVAINKMANDFSLDKIKCRRLDVDKDDVKMYLSNPLKYKKQILEKAQELYKKQKETGIVKSCYVTFSKVEKAYNDKFKDIN